MNDKKIKYLTHLHILDRRNRLHVTNHVIITCIEKGNYVLRTLRRMVSHIVFLRKIFEKLGIKKMKKSIALICFNLNIEVKRLGNLNIIWDKNPFRYVG